MARQKESFWDLVSKVIICRPGHCLKASGRKLFLQADKGYDAGWLLRELKELGVAEIVIPSRRARKEQRTLNKELYKERNKIECYFNRLKNWRRVATRYEKSARNFNAIVCFAATIINYSFTINTA